jgi:hypothetical protein
MSRGGAAIRASNPKGLLPRAEKAKPFDIPQGLITQPRDTDGDC